MSLFSVFGISGSGMDAYQTWLDAIGGNVANVNDSGPTSQPAYQSRSLIVSEAGTGQVGDGVKVTGVTLGSAQGELAWEPGNPQADVNGMVRHPVVDLPGQMVQMVMAERDYQANVSVITQARQAYESALGLGT
ncbi:MAG TPA: flagellar basal body rod C-terminal domain-containing protein [Acidimicrobiales bacterium]|nr:flagellar basal body rod C-terminal domain-containing protein [Acidimicrobiales bacterium]